VPFDGSTTAGDYVERSPVTNGYFSDAGANPPVNVQTLGRVWSTNGSAGTYTMDLYPASGPPIISGQGVTPTASAAGISLALDQAFGLARSTDQAGTDHSAIATSGGAGTTFTASTNPVLAAYTRSGWFVFVPTDANCASGATLDLGLGPKALVVQSSGALVAVGTNGCIQNIPYLVFEVGSPVTSFYLYP
jgi:hypothetical protein